MYQDIHTRSFFVKTYSYMIAQCESWIIMTEHVFTVFLHAASATALIWSLLHRKYNTPMQFVTHMNKKKTA